MTNMTPKVKKWSKIQIKSEPIEDVFGIVERDDQFKGQGLDHNVKMDLDQLDTWN